MDPGAALRAARRRKGLTQRGLSEVTGVPQSTIGRIESGAVMPRVDTLDALLKACDENLEAMPLLGQGIDRTLISYMLAMTLEDRFEYARSAAENLAELKAAVGR